MDRRVRKGLWILALALVLCGAVFAVWKYGPAGRRGGPYKMIYIGKIMDENNAFWVQLMQGVSMAAEEYGVDMSIDAPERENDYQGQRERVEWAISQQPDLLLFSPAGLVESQEVVALVEAAGIPLILVDSEVEGDYALSVVTTDNFRAGRIQGEHMAGLAGEDSQIAIIAHVEEASTAKERIAGVREGLGEYGDRVLGVWYCNSDYTLAYQAMQEVLDRHPQVDLVAGVNEYSAVGAAKAIRDRGLAGQVRLVGFDNSLEQIQLLEAGVFDAIVIQNPFKMGYLAVQTAVEYLETGEAIPRLDSDCRLITKEDLYTPENQKVLFMFTEE